MGGGVPKIRAFFGALYDKGYNILEYVYIYMVVPLLMGNSKLGGWFLTSISRTQGQQHETLTHEAGPSCFTSVRPPMSSRRTSCRSCWLVAETMYKQDTRDDLLNLAVSMLDVS